MKRLFPLIVAAAFLASGLQGGELFSHSGRQQHTAACPGAACQSCRHAPCEPLVQEPPLAVLTVLQPAPARLRQLFSEEIFHPPAA